MNRPLTSLTANLSGSTRREKLNGREYIVAPMTLMVPGVFNGSKGALAYTPDEIAKNHKQWDDIPITVQHPKYGGGYISASDPLIQEKQGIGFLRNSSIEDGKLKAEGWFDVKKTQRIDPQVHKALIENRKMELSTGLFTEDDPAPPGSHVNGKPFTHIARNHLADHLAILPDKKGACSLDMGCGLMVNEETQETPVENEDTQLRQNLWQWIGNKLGITDNRDWPQKKRDDAPTKDFAGPDQSFPIQTQADVDAAAHLVGKAKDPEAVKAKIKSIAKRKGLTVPDSWTANEETNDAEEMTAKANKATDDASTKKDHANAARLHAQASQANQSKSASMDPGPLRYGFQDQAAVHDRMAKDHALQACGAASGSPMIKNAQSGSDGQRPSGTTQEKKEPEMANKLTENERKELIGKLVTNCAGCEEAERKGFETLSDNVLKSLTANLKTEREVVANTKKPLTAAEWYDQAPREIQQTVKNAQDVMIREKREVIGQLTANVSVKEEKERLTANLEKKDLDELRDLAKLVPTVRESNPFSPGYQPTHAHYLGASTPVGNAYQAEDRDNVPLDTPVLNFEEMAKKRA